MEQDTINTMDLPLRYLLLFFHFECHLTNKDMYFEDIEQLAHFSLHLCKQNLVDILHFYAEINEVRGQERIFFVCSFIKVV